MIGNGMMIPIVLIAAFALHRHRSSGHLERAEMDRTDASGRPGESEERRWR